MKSFCMLYGSTDIKLELVSCLFLSLILVDIEKLEMGEWARPTGHELNI